MFPCWQWLPSALVLSGRFLFSPLLLLVNYFSSLFGHSSHLISLSQLSLTSPTMHFGELGVQTKGGLSVYVATEVALGDDRSRVEWRSGIWLQ